jgi:hypothetical protein
MPGKVKEVFSCEPFNEDKGPSVEHMLIIENINTVKQIQKKLGETLPPLHEKQTLVTLHNQSLKEINTMIDAEGKLDSDKFEKILSDMKNDLDNKMAKEKIGLESQKSELEDKNDGSEKTKEKLARIQNIIDGLTEKYKPSHDFIADTLKMGDDIRKGVKNFTKEQKDRLVGNIKMAMEDLNIVVGSMLQEASVLNSKTYESYQNARLMLKTVHDAFMSIIKNWK